MLDARLLHVGRYQPMPTFGYNSRIIVKRRVLVSGHIAYDGPLGTTDTQFNTIAVGVPAAIVPKSASLPFLPTGMTPLTDAILICQYKQFTNGTLLIQVGDVIIDMNEQQSDLGQSDVWQVEWAHDPSNSKIQIIAGINAGKLNQNLAEQS